MGKSKYPEHWTVGAWRGMPRYQCNYCPFDSLELTTISEHYAKRHAPPEIQEEVTVQRTDRFGNPIQEVANGQNDAH